MGISSLLDPLLDGLDGAIPALPSKPDCSTNVLRCGPPRVDFIGGGGQGATNRMDAINIATGGTSVDSGDLTVSKTTMTGSSNGHGGLG